MKKTLEYLENMKKILDDIINEQLTEIEKCSLAFADALERGSNIFLFGTGHSHILAEELFYRAGGLVKIQPVLETALMLHESASKSTEIERLEGYAEIIFESYSMKKDDVIVIISNSGRNGVCVDMASLAKEKGLTVIALTNLRHSKSGASRHKSGKKLYEFADIVLDNMGCIGDASIYFEEINRNAAPTSTSAGAAILNAAVCGCIEKMLSDGITPEVFSSSNIDGGDEINEQFIRKYKNTIKSL
ncbi:MAG: SIS domain-containing protein [Ruminococcaceae bacterium]|nr:SIS domain-containing protein [Oscillospiraceae bacterium]MBR3596681.1 SIS domain-containing protein [Clostridia bacterium]